MDADKQVPPDAEGRRRRSSLFLRQLALAMELPFIPIGAVLIGGGLGYLLDGQLHTGPWLALILGLLGFLAGIREILRRLPRGGSKNGSE